MKETITSAQLNSMYFTGLATDISADTLALVVITVADLNGLVSEEVAISALCKLIANKEDYGRVGDRARLVLAAILKNIAELSKSNIGV